MSKMGVVLLASVMTAVLTTGAIAAPPELETVEKQLEEAAKKVHSLTTDIVYTHESGATDGSGKKFTTTRQGTYAYSLQKDQLRTSVVWEPPQFKPKEAERHGGTWLSSSFYDGHYLYSMYWSKGGDPEMDLSGMVRKEKLKTRSVRTIGERLLEIEKDFSMHDSTIPEEIALASMDQIELWRHESNTKLLPNEKIGDQPVYVMEVSPDGPQQTGRRVYYYNQKHGYLMKLAIYGAGPKPLTTVEFKNVKVNAKIPPKRFEFKAPPGAQVIEVDEQGKPVEPTNRPAKKD